MSNGIIILDVSGELFETTLATLSKYPDSMLARMFAHSENGLPAMPKTKNGHYFLEVNPDSFKIILNWLRPGGHVESKDVTRSVLDLADYFALQDFPKPNDELITLDLNSKKEIKILKRTITRHAETDLAKFFNGESDTCEIRSKTNETGPMPIFETQPSHYFVDRPVKNSEMFFSFLRTKFVEKTVPYNVELEDELEYYGFKNGRDFFKSRDGSCLSWLKADLDDYDCHTDKSELIILDLNGDKQIKILRKTLRKEPLTALGRLFSGYFFDLDTNQGRQACEIIKKLPIQETQPGYYFVDRPSERSEAVFNLLKGAAIKQSGEIKSELAVYGYILNQHYFETGPNKDLLSITRT